MFSYLGAIVICSNRGIVLLREIEKVFEITLLPYERMSLKT